MASGRDASGKIVFLEQGNAKAGLQHILDRHENQFVQRGIPADQIPDSVMAAATQGKLVSMQNTRLVYEVEFQGKTQFISVQVGSIGFVVGTTQRQVN